MPLKLLLLKLLLLLGNGPPASRLPGEHSLTSPERHLDLNFNFKAVAATATGDLVKLRLGQFDWFA